MLFNEDFENFKPIFYYDFAKQIHDNLDKFSCDNSAILRSVISRAYYAAFLQVKARLEDEGYVFSGYEDHSKVKNILIHDKPIQTELFNKDIQSRLFDLQKNRIYCDYKFQIPEDNEKWATQDISTLLYFSKWIVQNVEVKSFSISFIFLFYALS
ncbi:MAG: hypothetical protein FWH29_01955 [Methanobrevibacter sp.]|nr:hypothetical protein [Methanobrevibacter sp.]